MKLNGVGMLARVSPRSMWAASALCVVVCVAGCSDGPSAKSERYTFPDWTVDEGMLDGGLPPVDAAVPIESGPCAANNGGCDPLTQCAVEADVVTCSACPGGYTGTGEVGCIVDPASPCATENGGCDVLTTCVIENDAVVCGACPSGYIGVGSAGCEVDTTGPCATNNGGCDALVSCIADGSNVTCGACPSGYTGSGETGCVQGSADPCLTNNGGCALLTTCSASGGTVTCGACPAGYMGTGTDGCTIIMGAARACDFGAAFEYCAEYKDEQTGAASAAILCDANTGSQGTLAVTCPSSGLVGICILGEGTPGEAWTYYYTDVFSASNCTGAGGRWQTP